MNRDDLPELQYITPSKNIRSIMQRGILSNVRAAKVPHESVAMQVIQDLREPKRVPGGRPLHEYVNLYINGRNKTMFKLHGGHRDLCVLRISAAVLDLPAVVVTDQNAASDYAIFKPSPDGLSVVEKELVFAERWTHPGDQIQEWRHGSAVCAEVLVPDSVPSRYVLGAYASCEESGLALAAAAPELGVTVDGHLFFVG